MRKQTLTEIHRMQKIAGIIKENTGFTHQDYSYQDDKIVMTGDVRNAILDNPELQKFIEPKNFIRNNKGQIVLWIDWMEPEQFNKLANFLGIEY